MLDLKKKADNVEVSELKMAECPVCHSYVCHTYFMQDAKSKKKSKWFACQCGVVFQSELPYGKYDIDYWTKRGAEYDKKLETSYHYPVRIYAPIIEELVYKRRVLLIGHPNNYQAEAFAERGWVPTSIDKNVSFKDSNRIIAADFEEYKFNLDTKYDLIWIYHTLKCLKDPVASLQLIPQLLSEGAILFIGDVDTDFIYTRSSSCFSHWMPEWNHIMWNKRAIVKQVESLGFNTIMCRSNHYDRFPYKDDFHGIWQKKYY